MMTSYFFVLPMVCQLGLSFDMSNSRLFHERLINNKLIHQEKWNELVEDTNETVAMKIFEEFIKNLSINNEKLRNNLSEKNFTEIAKICHQLSSSSQLIGLVDLGVSFKALQLKIKKNEEPTSNFQKLEKDVKLALDQIKIILDLTQVPTKLN